MLADATAAPLIALAVAACGNGGGGASASPTMRRLLAHLTERLGGIGRTYAEFATTWAPAQ